MRAATISPSPDLDGCALGLIVHDIGIHKHIMKVDDAHKGKVSGVCFADEHRLLSCGVDRNIKLWDTRDEDENGAGPSTVSRRSRSFRRKS